VDAARQASSECFCYIVECADGSYYTGWTTDPIRRLAAHNAGRGARYTRSRRPVRLVLLELQDHRSAAMKRERVIKMMTRERKRKLICEIRAATPGKRRRLKAPRSSEKA
jgi:putative endonuclease